MLKRCLKYIGVISLLVSPTSAQFGVPNRNKKGSTFEELQKEVQKGGDSFDTAGLMDAFSNMDMASLQNMLGAALSDPETANQLQEYQKQFSEALDSLKKMSPEEIQENLQKNIEAMMDPSYINSLMSEMDTYIQSAVEQGLVTPEEAQEYLENPEGLKEKMGDIFTQMQNLMSNENYINAMMNMFGGLKDIADDPAGSFSKMADDLASVLDDDDKIEEARLQLLSNPGDLADSEMASLFQTEEMLDILKNPKKFREYVKKGQEMMRGTYQDEL